MTIELTALLAKAESDRARQHKAATEEAARRERANLSDDRKRAQRTASELLGLETDQGAWHRLELPEKLTSHASRTVWHPTDDDEVRLAFRHRGVTAGGDVLTVLSLAPETDEWVGASGEIRRLGDLPEVVESARRNATRWDEDAAEFEGDPDLAAAAAEEPKVRLEGDSIAEILERAIAILAVRHATPTDA